MLSRSAIFKAAWKVARSGAARFGGRASRYFACALRQVYADIAAQLAKPARLVPAPVRQLAGLAGDVVTLLAGLATWCTLSLRHVATWIRGHCAITAPDVNVAPGDSTTRQRDARYSWKLRARR